MFFEILGLSFIVMNWALYHNPIFVYIIIIVFVAVVIVIVCLFVSVGMFSCLNLCFDSYAASLHIYSE